MAAQIVKSAEEIEVAAMRAQKASFAAEDEGDTDDLAEGIYSFWQWMTGNSDVDPTLELGDDV